MPESVKDVLNHEFNKDFFGLASVTPAHGVHDKPGNKQTLEKIAKLPLIFDQIIQLRLFRKSALEGGITIPQLRKLEVTTEWGKPVLPLPTINNLFGYGDSRDYQQSIRALQREATLAMEDFLEKNTNDVSMAPSRRALFSLMGAIKLEPEKVTENYYSNIGERQAAHRLHFDAILKEHAFFELDEEFVGMDFLKDKIWMLKKSRDFRADFTGDDDEGSSSMHMAFAADRGMGKSTVVKAIAPAFFRLGLTPKNLVTKLSLSSISAPTLGAEEQAVRNAFSNGQGGIVFFDEVDTAAGHISASQKRSSVSQVINELAEEMRKNTCLIVATYPKHMPFFLDSDDGLRSRFGNRIIEFPPQPTKNFVTMFERKMEAAGFYLENDQARSVLWDKISTMRKEQDRSFGNGRTIREMLQFSEGYLADRHGPRIITTQDMAKITSEFNLATKPEKLDIYTEENPFRAKALLQPNPESTEKVVKLRVSAPTAS
jgi:hypothetical protein